jgi:hypothetical protein
MTDKATATDRRPDRLPVAATPTVGISFGTGLARKTTEQLAEREWKRGSAAGPRCLAVSDAPRTAKNAARTKALRLFRRTQYNGPINIVTMPALYWMFEQNLLSMRETQIRLEQHGPARTFITAIEEDEAIYRSSLKYIPGWQHGIVSCEAIGCATSSLSTQLIAGYHRCAFEDFAFLDTSTYYGGAWFDFNGPLTARRLTGLSHFWNHRLTETMVVTYMRARAEAATNLRAQSAGGFAQLLQSLCDRSEIVGLIDYADTAPMQQVALRRSHRKPRGT